MKIKLYVIEFHGGRPGYVEKSNRMNRVYDRDGNRIHHASHTPFQTKSLLGEYEEKDEGVFTSLIQGHKGHTCKSSQQTLSTPSLSSSSLPLA